jgi:probable F420-dependent oxidoreductase
VIAITIAEAPGYLQGGGKRWKETTMRVETGLLNLETEQYAGSGQVAATIGGIAANARAIEDLGFDVATMPEAGYDPFLPLMVAAEHTQRLRLATNVAIAFPRSPMVVAQLAWDLQRYSGGRFQLGLGTQVKGHNERRYSTPWTAPPGPRLREYLLCLQAIFASFQNGKQPTYFEGKHYQFTLIPPFFNPGPSPHPHVPLYLAAVNPYMCRLAGELGDGLRLHPIATFKYAKEVVLPTVELGARKAGRQLADIDVVGAPFLALGRTDAEIAAAKDGLRQRIAFYASTRTYHSVLEFHGWTDAGLELHRLSVQGKWQEMPRVITDAMLDELAIIGTYDDLVPRLTARCGGIFSSVTLDLPAPFRQDKARVREVLQALQQR